MRIAVTSRSFSRHPVLRAELLARHPDVTFNDQGVSLSGESLVKFLRGHERAITALERLDESVFAALPELKVISKYGVGLDMLDLKAMERYGVQLGWTGGVNRRSVAELVIAFSIMMLRHLPVANDELRRGIWRQHIGRQLSDRTVGIIGCGHVGKEVARLLRAFGCQLLVHDIRQDESFYAAHAIRPTTLNDLLRESDIVTLHVPLDRSTYGILSAERLDLMKRGAMLINTARGNLVDEAALAAALSDGRLAAAAFDVFATEPPSNLQLVQLQNFYATPHIGGSAEEAILAMGRAAIAGLETFGTPTIVALG